jgi:CheY-like chemotaxis protein
MNIEKVLVVDDSKVAHLTLRKMLTERGIGVDWVGSGEDSIAYLRQQKPDVIFMDVMMPGMDGFETAHSITSDTAIGALPIIMCSANATDEDKKNAEKSGAIDFLSKPYTAAELDQILNKVRSLSTAPEAIAEPEPELELATESVAEELEPVLEFDGLPALNDDFSSDFDSSLTGQDDSSFELPEADDIRSPALPQAAFSESEIIERAERAARSAAEKIAQNVAAATAERIVERAIQSAQEAATQKATQAAIQAAKSTTQTVAKEIVRSISEQLSRKVNDIIAQHLTSQKQAAPDLNQLRSEIIQALDENMSQQVQEILKGEGTQQRLMKLVQVHALPAVEENARRAANEVVEEFSRQMAETDQTQAAFSRANRAMIIAVIALILSGGMAVFSFLLGG